MFYLGWIANIFLLFGMWVLGYKWRSSHLFLAFGDFLYVLIGLYHNMYDIAFICGVFSFLSVRNYILWDKHE